MEAKQIVIENRLFGPYKEEWGNKSIKFAKDIIDGSGTKSICS